MDEWEAEEFRFVTYLVVRQAVRATRIASDDEVTNGRLAAQLRSRGLDVDCNWAEAQELLADKRAAAAARKAAKR